MKMNGSVHSQVIGINHTNELAHKLCGKCIIALTLEIDMIICNKLG